MAKVFCGVDFGTTNSSVALSDGQQTRVVELDPENDNPTSLPSLLYIARDGEEIVGRGAATAFIERNVGREVKLKQVDLGISIEAYVASEPDKSESYRPPEESGALREAVRARATVEVNLPGRLFQSLKSMLRLRSFTGTRVFEQHYQIEQLVAAILERVRHGAEIAAGERIERAAFGRPVRFAMDDGEDAAAEQRLRVAASLAGFKDIVFFYEPVAACVEYAIATDRRQRLMVVDIGGGTCDVCVMEFGGAHGAAARLSESRILGVSGIPVAGDAIDKEIIRAKIFPCLGSESHYGPSNLRMPQYLYSAVADWQNLYKLNTEETINWLLALETISTQPEAIRALRLLIQRNYGYLVAREVEQAKKRLSFVAETRIELNQDGINIAEHLVQSEFAHIIEHELERMEQCIEEAEAAAGVTPGDIDFVLTTGGTCLIPAIREMLIRRYGLGRMLHRETFTSVAAGLAIVAQFT